MELVEASLLAIAVVLLVAYYLDQRRTVKLHLDRTAHGAALQARASLSTSRTSSTETDCSTGPKIAILFGTQSGTAESFAEGFCKEARARGFAPKLSDLESYDYRNELEREQCVIVYIATHGEGDPPDSAADFYNWLLSDDLSRDLLSKVAFAVFGLGNRQYEHFNKCGTVVDKRLSYLGGQRLLELGLGDDSCCIEEDNENWRSNLWPKLNERFGIDACQFVGAQVVVYEPSFRLVFGDLPEVDVSFRNRRSSSSSLSTHRLVDVLSAQQLLKKPTEMASTVHIVLDLRERALPYGTAHNLGVHPRNDYKVVAKLCERLGYDPNLRFTLRRLKTSSTKKHPVPSPCSVRDALLWHLDLMSPPRKAFLGFLSQYARDPEEKARLANMSLPAGKQDYHEHLVADKKTIPEILDMFPSVMLPLEHFLEECPPLQPRMFTIASSALAHPDQIHLTVSLSRTVKARDRIHEGVCSTYLTNLKPGKDAVHIFLRKSSFFLPEDLSTPIIMCGAGTGIAPFRAFIQEGVYRCRTHGAKIAEWHLFFGCRNRDTDFLYEDELNEAFSLGVLSGLHLAFSREDPERKVYIQDRMKEQADMIWDLIDSRRAIVFVCGSTDMGKDIRNLLRDLVMTKTACDADAAALYLKRLSDDDRLVSELWG